MGADTDSPTEEEAERASILADLGSLESLMLRLERVHGADIDRVHPVHRPDAINLVHYLALRHDDSRALQRRLGESGLSSLGRCEPHVVATVESIRAVLGGTAPQPRPTFLSFDDGRAALDRNTDALFGPRPPGRVPRIMVTLPDEAAEDGGLVRDLVERGMDVARINGAHDPPERCRLMAAQVRAAAAEVGRPCRISIDLPGPKLRTGPLTEGPQVVRIRPERDLRGRPAAPGLATLATVTALATGTSGGPGPWLPVEPSWLARRLVGDSIELTDTRGSRREMRVVGIQPGRATVEVWDTTYVETGTVLSCGGDTAAVGALPCVPEYHRLQVGDLLVLVRHLRPQPPWRHGQPGCARIGCTLEDAFAAVSPGQRVVLDDGRLAGVVETASAEEIQVRIVAAPAGGGKLRADRGINLPETVLPTAALADADLALLEVAAAEADMVAISFLRQARDVEDVRRHLRRLGTEDLGIILKVETAAGFRNLPDILLHAMRSPRVGVMIARGDLAVEVGYERMAEVQEEILWLCEAAHLPAIWATEVLDQLARTGQPSRAEVTDAAMAQRAECVMLNKGPYVREAIGVLDDILRRMSGHQRKKTALLRPLRSWSEPDRTTA